ncbi:MAG: adenylate/guanylate cyclase domain-containing protein, partial [Alphaproteobacteria bacterium]
MPNESRFCAVLVADICGSTRLYETVGDDTAYRLVARCIAELADNISENDGRVIKTMGDGILSTFAMAEGAFDAAVAMQQGRGDSDILIRVGINYGSVVINGQDVFGDSVNVAAHLLTLAKPGEIILTGEMVQT